MACVHGICAWHVCMACVHGICAWHVHGMCMCMAWHTHGTTRVARAWHMHGTHTAHVLHTRDTSMARVSTCLPANICSRWSKPSWRRSRSGYGGGGISIRRWRTPRWRGIISSRPSVAVARASACSMCYYRGFRAFPPAARAACGERRVAWAKARRVPQGPRRSEPRGRARAGVYTCTM